MIIKKIAFYASSTPNKLALVDNHFQFTYSDLYKKILNFTQSLHIPLKKNGIVVIYLKSNAAKWIAILSLRSLGFTTINVADLNILRDLKLKGIVSIVHEGLSDHDILILKEVSSNLTFVQYEDGLLSNNKNSFKINYDLPWGDHLEYTSGSTGSYKAVLRESKDLECLIERAIREFEINSDNIFYLGAVHPGTGVGNKVPLACFYLGATCIYNQDVNYNKGFFDSNADRAFMTPIIMRGLFTSIEAFQKKRNKLRIYCGGGFLDSSLVMSIKSKLNCSVFLNYAATECGVVLQNEIQKTDDCVWIKPILSKKIKIVDDQFKEVEINQEGQLAILLEQCDPKSYINDELATKEAFSEGYFYTGDIAIKQSDGKIRVIGRQKNVINLGGDKLPVEPIELNLKQTLGVNNVCLYSLQSPNGKPCLTVVIEAEEPPSEDLLFEFSKKYGVFFSYIKFHLLSKFPTQLNGLMKVDRKEILKKINQNTQFRTFNVTFGPKNG